MSGTFHLNSNYVSGYTLVDSRWFSNSAVSRKTPATTLPCSSCLDHKLNGRLKCAADGSSFVCRASSGGYRRNPDFSRLNKHGRNRQSEDRDGFDGENSDMLSSRNGSLLSLSNSPKFQATSSPGPREKEIVELFRKVQAQLRARAAAKREDKKVEEEEASRGEGKESETVDSLLKLLRKHSGEQSKRVNKLSSQEDSSYPPQQEDPLDRRQDRNSGNIVKSWSKDQNGSPAFTRPTSNFRRKSPVPRFQSPPTYSSEASYDQTSSYSVTWTHKKGTSESRDEPESEPQAEIEPEYDEHEPVTAILEPESELQLDASSFFQEEDDNVTLGVLSDDDEEESVDDADEEVEEEAVKDEDLSTLKLMELRAIAKSRGLKGFSKMKKAQLVELLGSDTS
ncbi:unnamed protein product [Eruca vesicaria subsp. sativa]|uniref:Rho termination factor-like N-terminal domain-containing protein n=1 Tax=Eruca vesicaria subsp. sativa TaxID=29727 RepID=A0ABC8JTR6_ERUVS|nr:unnamed protein product [Eruca vesicaria subsp. sativa]